MTDLFSLIPQDTSGYFDKWIRGVWPVNHDWIKMHYRILRAQTRPRPANPWPDDGA